MVIRYKNPDGTGGVLTKPYTWEERAWVKHRATMDHGGPFKRLGPKPQTVAPAKPTKALALEFADLLDLDALEPGKDLDWNDVREVIGGLTEGAGSTVSSLAS